MPKKKKVALREASPSPLLFVSFNLHQASINVEVNLILAELPEQFGVGKNVHTGGEALVKSKNVCIFNALGKYLP